MITLLNTWTQNLSVIGEGKLSNVLFNSTSFKAINKFIKYLQQTEYNKFIANLKVRLIAVVKW